MITPAQSPLQFDPIAARVEPDHNVNNARPASSSSSARSSSHTIFARPQSSSPALQPESWPDRSSSALDDGPDTVPQQEKRSSPYSLSGSSLDTALARMPPPDKPSKPKSLFYILPNSRGVLDHENALPRERWWECNLSEFFSVVASRAEKPDASLTCLTFTYNWAPQQPFVVHRHGGDQYWDEIRERVKATFLKTRNATKKRVRFELWIECGDKTNLDEVEEEEDGC